MALSRLLVVILFLQLGPSSSLDTIPDTVPVTGGTIAEKSSGIPPPPDDDDTAELRRAAEAIKARIRSSSTGPIPFAPPFERSMGNDNSNDAPGIETPIVHQPPATTTDDDPSSTSANLHYAAEAIKRKIRTQQQGTTDWMAPLRMIQLEVSEEEEEDEEDSRPVTEDSQVFPGPDTPLAHHPRRMEESDTGIREEDAMEHSAATNVGTIHQGPPKNEPEDQMLWLGEEGERLQPSQEQPSQRTFADTNRLAHNALQPGHPGAAERPGASSERDATDEVRDSETPVATTSTAAGSNKNTTTSDVGPKDETVEEDEDDRTHLDMFGEAAKEYLTQRVIPPTDAECQWDWRTLHCEPHCQCSYQWKRGDYHFGRSCRYRPSNSNTDNTTCEASIWIHDRPVPRRVLSLVRQTAGIVRDKFQHSVGSVWRSGRDQVTAVQQRLCGDDDDDDEDACWMTPPQLSFPEKLVCRNHYRLCEQKEQKRQLSTLASFWKQKSETVMQDDAWDF